MLYPLSARAWENAVEFDPTLRVALLDPWLGRKTPLYRERIVDPDGIARRYAIYALDESAIEVEARR